jgi:rhamnose utilization protein RhaD (predicted bifunctional aldolase and dehydrogenase)
MAQLDHLSDSDMVSQQRTALKDSSAPNPSVEAILHAIIPFKFVDHTHADAVVTITNTPNGKELISEIYGKNMLIIDYVMPGFILAKTVYDQTQGVDWASLDGIVLLNHGVFTFDDNAKKAYEKMIEIVDIAQKYLDEHAKLELHEEIKNIDENLLDTLQKEVAHLRGSDIVLKVSDSMEAAAFSKLENLEEIVHSGPLTPEHVIRTKPYPVIIADADGAESALKEFKESYEAYYNEYKTDEILLDLAPRYAVVKGCGFVTFGKDEKEAEIIYDIINHTVEAMLRAQMLGGWKSLSKKDIFEMEYWELEQSKLKKNTIK